MGNGLTKALGIRAILLAKGLRWSSAMRSSFFRLAYSTVALAQIIGVFLGRSCSLRFKFSHAILLRRFAGMRRHCAACFLLNGHLTPRFLLYAFALLF